MPLSQAAHPIFGAGYVKNMTVNVSMSAFLEAGECDAFSSNGTHLYLEPDDAQTYPFTPCHGYQGLNNIPVGTILDFTVKACAGPNDETHSDSGVHVGFDIYNDSTSCGGPGCIEATLNGIGTRVQCPDFLQYNFSANITHTGINPRLNYPSSAKYANFSNSKYADGTPFVITDSTTSGDYNYGGWGKTSPIESITDIAFWVDVWFESQDSGLFWDMQIITWTPGTEEEPSDPIVPALWLNETFGVNTTADGWADVGAGQNCGNYDRGISTWNPHCEDNNGNSMGWQTNNWTCQDASNTANFCTLPGGANINQSTSDMAAIFAKTPFQDGYKGLNYTIPIGWGCDGGPCANISVRAKAVAESMDNVTEWAGLAIIEPDGTHHYIWRVNGSNTTAQGYGLASGGFPKTSDYKHIYVENICATVIDCTTISRAYLMPLVSASDDGDRLYIDDVVVQGQAALVPDPVNTSFNFTIVDAMTGSPHNYSAGDKVTINFTFQVNGSFLNDLNFSINNNNTIGGELAPIALTEYTIPAIPLRNITLNGTWNNSATDGIETTEEVFFDYTLKGGDETLLLFNVVHECGAPPNSSVQLMQYNGVNATTIRTQLHHDSTYGIYSGLFYIKDEDLGEAGTYTVDIALTGSCDEVYVAVAELHHVNQTHPIISSNMTKGNGASITNTTIYAEQYSYIFQGMGEGSPSVFTPPKGWTKWYGENRSSSSSGGNYYFAPADGWYQANVTSSETNRKSMIVASIRRSLTSQDETLGYREQFAPIGGNKYQVNLTSNITLTGLADTYLNGNYTDGTKLSSLNVSNLDFESSVLGVGNITYPLNASSLTNGTNTQIRWTHNDTSGFEITAWLFLDGRLNQSSTSNFTVNLTVGKHNATILTGFAGASNSTRNSSIVFFSVNPPGIGNITGPTNNTAYASGTNFNINWTSNDTSGFSVIAYLFLDGKWNSSSTSNFTLNLAPGIHNASILIGYPTGVNSTQLSGRIDFNISASSEPEVESAASFCSDSIAPFTALIVLFPVIIIVLVAAILFLSFRGSIDLNALTNNQVQGALMAIGGLVFTAILIGLGIMVVSRIC